MGMSDNKDKVNWSCISQNQKLSINFIREFYQLGVEIIGEKDISRLEIYDLLKKVI